MSPTDKRKNSATLAEHFGSGSIDHANWQEFPRAFQQTKFMEFYHESGEKRLSQGT